MAEKQTGKIMKKVLSKIVPGKRVPGGILKLRRRIYGYWFKPGEYELILEVRDLTDRVRKDPDGRTRDEKRWKLQIRKREPGERRTSR